MFIKKEPIDYKTISKEDRTYLLGFYRPVLRKLMNRDEIIKANGFVKKGWLEKGNSECRPHTVIYYLDSVIARELLND